MLNIFNSIAYIQRFNNILNIYQILTVFSRLAQVTKLIHKNLNSTVQHEVLFYSTLLAKLIEGANHIININMHIEERVYEVSLRNSEGVKVLTGLPNHILAEGFEGLVDAERTQVCFFFNLIPKLLY